MSDVQQRAYEIVKNTWQYGNSFRNSQEIVDALAAANLLVDDDTAGLRARHARLQRDYDNLDEAVDGLRDSHRRALRRCQADLSVVIDRLRTENEQLRRLLPE